MMYMNSCSIINSAFPTLKTHTWLEILEINITFRITRDYGQCVVSVPMLWFIYPILEMSSSQNLFRRFQIFTLQKTGKILNDELFQNM